MSGACSPGGGGSTAELSVSSDERALLAEVQVMLRSRQVDQARTALENLRDPLLVEDHRVRRVKKMLDGVISEPTLNEAADLLAQVRKSEE